MHRSQHAQEAIRATHVRTASIASIARRKEGRAECVNVEVEIESVTQTLFSSLR